MTIIRKHLKDYGNTLEIVPFIGHNGNVNDVPDDPNSASFKFKLKITGKTRNDGTKEQIFK